MPNNLLKRILRLIIPIVGCGVDLFKRNPKHKETFKLGQSIVKYFKDIK